MILALIAIVAVPSTLGRKVGGEPRAESIAGPPTVGQCVTAVRTVPRSSTKSASTPVAALPVATVVPWCEGAVIGEVISVKPSSSTPVISTLDEYYRANPDCRSQVETYLGTFSASDILGVRWTKSLSVEAVLVGPDAHDRAAGRTWVACVVTTGGSSYGAPAPLASAWANRTMPDAFGLCWAEDVQPRGMSLPCRSAHRTQQIAIGFVAGPSDSATSIVSAASRDAVARGCREIAASTLGVPDPTLGGALEVRVVADRSGSPFVQCAVTVTGGRHLVGSLIGLGTRPLPLG